MKENFLYDNLGNKYPKKKAPKNRLLEYKRLEKEHLNNVKEEVKKLKHNLTNKTKKEIDLKMELLEAKLNIDFYNKYRGLTYDAELIYESSVLKSNQLPNIIELYTNTLEDIKKVNEELNNVDIQKEEKAKEKYLKIRDEKNKILQQDIAKLKLKKDQGLISDKAYKNEIKQYKRKLKDELEIEELNSPKKYLLSSKRLLTYFLKEEVKIRYRNMNSDLSDIKKRIPIEVENTYSYLPYVSFLFPGLGQLVLGQTLKAFMFFLGTLFTYFIAIPYSIGFGNYRGEGLYGLYSLAENGKRIDKSIIFMIEGVVAIALLCFAIGIIVSSFIDVKRVVNDRIKGIRQNNNFETLELLLEDGFPYIINAVTFFLLTFIVLIPITTTILLSFTGMDPKHQSKFAWVGLQNYLLLIRGEGIAGGPFWLILGWTIVWTLVATSVAILVGFGLALIVNNDRVIGKPIIRGIFLLPWAVPAFITIMFFSIMTSSTGPITELLNRIGFDIVIKQSIMGTRIFVILLQTWLGSAYVFLLATGVLQAIPSDLYEAADIDGATKWQTISKITVPLVLFQTAPLLIGQYTFNFNNFSIIYLFNGGGPFDPSKYGNLAGGSDLLISYIFKLTIEKNYQSIGAAITIFISIGLMVFAYIGFKNSKAFKEDSL